MQSVRFCILGAGPAGLAFAATLHAAGEHSFIVLEKERVAGGLCRSEDVDGGPLDIGGGHFLDVRKTKVLEFLFKYLPREEWTEYHRVSTIRLRGVEVEHPLEGNIWQLPIDAQVDFLESIAQAGCVRGEAQPKEFDAWIKWKLGQRITEEYMLPYNRKIWSMPLNELGTYWLYKLPSVSFRETLQGCLQRQSTGALPAHGKFLYPKHFGYGEVWRRIGETLGERLRLNTPLESIDVGNRVVNGAFHYQHLITTIPWPAVAQHSRQPLPDTIESAIRQLKHCGIDIDYYTDNLKSNAHWTYEPDEKKSYHRLLLRHNFAANCRGYWTETNCARAQTHGTFWHRNEFAYPINTLAKPNHVTTITNWAKLQNIVPVGRWGTWEHLNSDVAVEQAVQTANTALMYE